MNFDPSYHDDRNDAISTALLAFEAQKAFQSAFRHPSENDAMTVNEAADIARAVPEIAQYIAEHHGRVATLTARLSYFTVDDDEVAFSVDNNFVDSDDGASEVKGLFVGLVFLQELDPTVSHDIRGLCFNLRFFDEWGRGHNGESQMVSGSYLVPLTSLVQPPEFDEPLIEPQI